MYQRTARSLPRCNDQVALNKEQVNFEDTKLFPTAERPRDPNPVSTRKGLAIPHFDNHFFASNSRPGPCIQARVLQVNLRGGAPAIRLTTPIYHP